MYYNSQFYLNVFWFWHSVSFLKFLGDFTGIYIRIWRSTWKKWSYTRKKSTWRKKMFFLQKRGHVIRKVYAIWTKCKFELNLYSEWVLQCFVFYKNNTRLENNISNIIKTDYKHCLSAIIPIWLVEGTWSLLVSFCIKTRKNRINNN